MAAVAEVLAHSDPQFLRAGRHHAEHPVKRELIQGLTSNWAETDV